MGSVFLPPPPLNHVGQAVSFHTIRVLRGCQHTTSSPEVAAKARGDLHPGLAVVTSVLFAAGLLALAGYEFRSQDY